MPRVAGLLLAQATRRGRSGTAGLALSPAHLPDSFPARFSFSFAFFARSQLHRRSRSNSDELALARRRKIAHYIFIAVPPCSLLPPPPLGCTV